jgi:asparagine synthase (glutamine-hydrolysing)
MCGIAGMLTLGGGSAGIDRERLRRMSDSLAHRGPDDEGLWTGESPDLKCGLAARRLAVTDPGPASAQPFLYMDRYVVVHNGEIYNHRELKRLLEEEGCPFRTDADTEVVAAAYHRFGDSCVDRFDGMFAFALWDMEQKRLFCARDRFGEKPFYHHFDSSTRTLSFASEMKALWAAGLPRRMRPASMLHFLTLGITSHPLFPELTFFKDIFQIPPAHTLTFGEGMEAPVWERYWDLDKETVSDITEAEAVSRFRELLEESVRRRIPSGSPWGLMLSGGMDSTSIAALCQRLSASGSSMGNFSASFPGFKKDESLLIRSVAEKTGFRPRMAVPDADGLLEHIGTIARHQEEPFGSAGVYAQWVVHRMAKREGVKVLLDGQGADEVLGGYTRYVHWQLQERLRQVKREAVDEEARALISNGFLEGWDWKNRLAARFPGMAAAWLERKAGKKHRRNADIERGFLESHSGAGFIHKPHVRRLNDILYFDACMGPLQTLLRYADRNAMAHGIEVRLPFLSHGLVEFLFALPSDLKIRGGWTKWILRQSIKGLIPPEVSEQKGKTGFEPPQADWMGHEKIRAEIGKGRQHLVDAGMLHSSVLKRPLDPQPAYAEDNRDWRYWNASLFL